MTAPASGCSTPAISRSSVDLPSPLRPTTPMRSPAETPSVTSVEHGARGVALGGVLEVDEVARRGHRRYAAYVLGWESCEEEQRHLDETGAAYDVAFAALTGPRPPSGIDDYANEALEAMRRERIRVYTEASGPLYFGRIDRVDGETLYVGRHAVWSADNELLSVNWRAPAAEPFYTATEHDPHGHAAPPAAGHRGAAPCSASSTSRWSPGARTT